MTEDKNPEQESNENLDTIEESNQNLDITNQKKENKNVLKWLSLGVAVALGGGLSYGYYFVQQELSPFIAKNLSSAINRPVKLGKVTKFSLTAIEFGKTAIPATKEDRDWVAVEKIKVGFKPLKIIFTRTLKLDVSLINPDVYLEQDNNGVWLATKLPATEPGLIKIELDKIQVENAIINVAPRLANVLLEPIPIIVPTASSQFLDRNQSRDLAVTALLGKGKVEIGGNLRPKGAVAKVKIGVKNLELAEIIPDLPEVPVKVLEGKFNTDLDVRIKGGQLPWVTGTASVENLIAQPLLKELKQNLKPNLKPNLPPAITNGLFSFKGQTVELTQLTASLGAMNLDVEGAIALSGFQVRAKTQPVVLEQFLESLKLKELVPVPVTGEMTATVDLVGALDNPKVAALVTATKPTTIDRVEFTKLQAIAQLVEKKLQTEFLAVPAVGGEVRGLAQAIVEQDGNVVLNLQGEKLPAATLANLYGIDNLPLPLGNASARAQIVVPLNKPKDFIANAVGILDAGEGAIAFRDFQVAKGVWQGKVLASDIQLSSLSILPTELQPLQEQGTISSEFQVTGKWNSLAPETIAANGVAFIDLIDGTVRSKIQVAEGQWQTDLSASLQLAKFTQIPPQLRGAVEGDFQFAGSLTNFSPGAMAGRGQGILELPNNGGKVALTQLEYINNLWQAEVQGQEVEIASFASLFPPETSAFTSQLGKGSGSFLVRGNLADLTPQAILLAGEGVLDVAGGEVRASKIELVNGNWRTKIIAKEVQAGRFGSLFPPEASSLTPQLGNVNGSFLIGGNLANLTPEGILLAGEGSIGLAGGEVRATKLELAEGVWRSNIIAQEVEVGRFSSLFPPETSAIASEIGKANGEVFLAANLADLTPKTIVALGQGSISLAGGEVRATKLELAEGLWRSSIIAKEVEVPRLAALFPPETRGITSEIGKANGAVFLAGNLADFTPETIAAAGEASVAVGGGEVRATKIELADGFWRSKIIAQAIEASRFVSLLPPEASFLQSELGQANGEFLLGGNLRNLSVTGIDLIGEGSLAVAGGIANANQLQLSQGNFQTIVTSSNINLNAFSQELSGNLEGQLGVAGNLANLEPTAIKATGIFNLSEGVAPVAGPLNAILDWNGKSLKILQATAPGLDVRGAMELNLAQSGLDAVQGLDLDVEAEGFNLAQLPLPTSARSNFKLAGAMDLVATIQGTPSSPQVKGDVALQNLTLGVPGDVSLAFDPLLEGNVTVVGGEGVNVSLAGNEDLIEIALAEDYLPESFHLRIDKFNALGSRQGDVLSVQTEELPLAPLQGLLKLGLEQLSNIPLPIRNVLGVKKIGGNLTAEVGVDLKSWNSAGEVAIANPVFGTLAGDQAAINFQYQDGGATIEEAKFQQGETEYALLNTSIVPTAAGVDFKALVRVKEGSIEQLLQTAGISNFEDLSLYTGVLQYGTGADLDNITLGTSPPNLEEELIIFSQVEELLAQKQKADELLNLPPLDKLEGKFNAEIAVSGSTNKIEEIEATFDLEGNQWQWGKNAVEQLVARGNWRNGILDLEPARLQLEPESWIAFSGKLAQDTQTGELEIVNLPIATIKNTVKLPAGIGTTGRVDGQISLIGSLGNPGAKGEIKISNATLNQKQIHLTTTEFEYQNARLDDFTVETFLTADIDPLRVTGNLPYKLPFAKVSPDSDKFNLEIEIKDKGLEIMDVLTAQQVTWVDGNGEVKLQLTGALEPERGLREELVADGSIILSNGTIAAQRLEKEQITNINGKINFNLDDINVEQLESNLGEGTITIAGVLPVAKVEEEENPLTVNLDLQSLSLEGIYNGGVRGEVEISGSALKPMVGGNLELFNGNIILPESTSKEKVVTSPTDIVSIAPTDKVSSGSSDTVVNEKNVNEKKPVTDLIALNDLSLTLGNKVEVRQPLLFNFTTTGELKVGGTVNDIRPVGVINIDRGNISVFNTQFSLERNYDKQEVTFTPTSGLDPHLNVRLSTTVTESGNRAIAIDGGAAEVTDTTADLSGGSRKIRIQATVNGPASQLSDRIQLTSRPSRSETEIITLLGASVVDSFTDGDTTLGFANLASNTRLFRNFENSIQELTGLSEFRLFPVTIENNETQSSNLALGIDLGVDLGDASVGVSRILAADNPFQYSARYRFGENILLRGATDLSGNEGAGIQFETRW